MKNIIFNEAQSTEVARLIDKATNKERERIKKLIDELDIELFLEEIVDKKGNKIKVPKEIWDLWEIYWEHIKEKLNHKLKETSFLRGKNK